MSLLRDRIAAVEARLAAACQRASRARSDVTLVAVTKTISIELAALLPELGLLDLGENRPQELWRKAGALPASVRWHMIGHLQRNKIEQTLPLATMIHSVDSVRLLQAIEADAARQNRDVPVLLEVNVSSEASKQGFGLIELPNVVRSLPPLSHVRLAGLMTMAPLQQPESCRSLFGALRRLREELQTIVAPQHSLQHLSMGMSNDFEVAVEEGSTHVRLGSVLFEGLSS